MTIDMQKRERFCDGWPKAHYCERAREYYLHVRQWEARTTVISKHGEYITMPAGERDSEEGIWLCDSCAAQLCATHVLDRRITREIYVCPFNAAPYTEHRPFGVWKEYRI